MSNKKSGPAECKPVKHLHVPSGECFDKVISCSDDSDIVPLFTTPQPCQRCDEIHRDLVVQKGMLKIIRSERDELQAKVAEQETFIKTLSDVCDSSKKRITELTQSLSTATFINHQHEDQITSAEAVIEKCRDGLRDADSESSAANRALTAIKEYQEGKKS